MVKNYMKRGINKVFSTNNGFMLAFSYKYKHNMRIIGSKLPGSTVIILENSLVHH